MHCCRGSTPDLAGGAYSAAPDPLAGFGGGEGGEKGKGKEGKGRVEEKRGRGKGCPPRNGRPGSATGEPW